MNRLLFWIAALSCQLIFSSPAFAVVSVGRAPCAFPTIQRAIDAILASQQNGDFFDNDIVVAGGNYNEALTISGSGIPGGALMSITGGYNANCTAPQADSGTVINGAGRSGSVLTIRNGTLRIELRALELRGANHTGNGGAISFDGAGLLGLTNVQLKDNSAGFGGGLYANGRAPGLSVYLHRGTSVLNNNAGRAGGGVRVQGQTRLFMLEGNTFINGNVVSLVGTDGAGGGLQIVGPARADIGSGIISGNSAELGGGVAINVSNEQGGILRFFSTIAGEPTRITFNSASRSGGGIYVDADFANGRGAACGFGYNISSNVAAEGAAVYADTVGSGISRIGAYVDLTSSALPPQGISGCKGVEDAAVLGALPCPRGRSCNFMNDNRAQDSNGNPTGGSIVLIQSDGAGHAESVEMRRNRGAHLWRGFSVFSRPADEIFLSNCLLVDNAMTSDLIRMDENGDVRLTNCTVTGNTIAGSHVLSLTGDLKLTESLVWQFGKPILEQSAGRVRVVRNVLASEIVTLGGGASVEAIFPQFVAPAIGNYRLLPTSPALDFAPGLAGADLDGRPRTVDLPVPNRAGPLDLGAYELSSLPTFPPDETFDEAIVPSFPAGWISARNGAGIDWITVNSGSTDLGISAYTDDPGSPSDKTLESPAFDVVAHGKLTFLHKTDLEFSTVDVGTGYDGAVLEIAILPGPFTDIVAAGGRFITGGYNRTISECCSSPLAGRPAWSGAAPGYEPVVVRLPERANGLRVKLRWRVVSDLSFGRSGYSIDNVHVDVDGDIDPSEDVIFSNSCE